MKDNKENILNGCYIDIDTAKMSSVVNISSEATSYNLHRSGKGSVADEWLNEDNDEELERLKNNAYLAFKEIFND